MGLQDGNVNFKKIGDEVVFPSGAQRDARAGKGAFHWMPWDAVFLVSRIYETGNIGRSKDGTGDDRNWENGMPIQGFLQSAMNHITAYLAGDRSEAHLPQAAWNVINAIQTSIWVWAGWRPASLNRLVNHRGPRSEEPACPLSPMEIEWLKVRNVVKEPEDDYSDVKTPQVQGCNDSPCICKDGYGHKAGRLHSAGAGK